MTAEPSVISDREALRRVLPGRPLDLDSARALLCELLAAGDIAGARDLVASLDALTEPR